MAAIDAKTVMKLRKETGSSLMRCKEALTASSGDMEGAKDYLRKKGLETAQGLSGRETRNGFVAHYVHHDGTIGVLIELNCETDFVARNKDFQAMGSDLAMHVASMKPKYLDRSAIDSEVLDKEREIYRERFLAEGKPEKIVDKIVDGQIKKFYAANCLLDQEFVKAVKGETVAEVLKAAMAKIGENITVPRFVRFEVGG